MLTDKDEDGGISEEIVEENGRYGNRPMNMKSRDFHLTLAPRGQNILKKAPGKHSKSRLVEMALIDSNLQFKELCQKLGCNYLIKSNTEQADIDPKYEQARYELYYAWIDLITSSYELGDSQDPYKNRDHMNKLKEFNKKSDRVRVLIQKKTDADIKNQKKSKKKNMYDSRGKRYGCASMVSAATALLIVMLSGLLVSTALDNIQVVYQYASWVVASLLFVGMLYIGWRLQRLLFRNKLRSCNSAHVTSTDSDSHKYGSRA